MYTDVLIIGTGAAGLYASLNMRNDLKITLVSKEEAYKCNSYLAQGGVASSLSKKDEKSYIEDTLKAGSNKNDLNMVKILVKESRENILQLEKIGVDFDKVNGKFDYTKEGAHSVNRILHYKDYTGKRIFQCLYNEVIKKDNINILENCNLVDININGNGNVCTGAFFINNDKVLNIKAKVIILATGGIGGLFKDSTNQPCLTGDGISIAVRNKINVKNMNYIQIHPTGLYENSQSLRRFLISESVRGEGGKLININGQRFIDELLPRDVVSKAIIEEEIKTSSPYVYLDISHMSKNFIINRFPAIYEGCLERGIDITKGKIPVTPVQHYFMGGIEVDKYSRTSMKNLFACGEVSCTGVHGKNRLASNSLLECLVFSKRACKYINSIISGIDLDYTKKDIDISEAEEIIKLNRKVAIYEFSHTNKIMEVKNEYISCR